MNPLKTFAATLFTKSAKVTPMAKMSIYTISIKSLQNQSIYIKDFKDKYILFVNVASKCGFTPQYKELQQLHDTYKSKLVIIGIPCNQFGKQEPGKASEIEEFCQVNYGVDFLITEKIDVKGPNQHELYSWLTNKEQNGYKNSTVKWNFQKYLVNPNGNLVDYFYSMTSPLSSKITKYLK